MITTGLLLAAGQGSRLRAVTPFKPLCPVAGRALIDHALDGMAAAGLTRAIVSLGYGADAIAAHLAGRQWPLEVVTVMTDYHQPNGVSALAARALIGPQGAVLAMCDHLVQPRHYRRLARAGAGEGGGRPREGRPCGFGLHLYLHLGWSSTVSRWRGWA